MIALFYSEKIAGNYFLTGGVILLILSLSITLAFAIPFLMPCSAQS